VKEIPWPDMEFPVMLLAGFHWDINPMAGCAIFSNATG